MIREERKKRNEDLESLIESLLDRECIEDFEYMRFLKSELELIGDHDGKIIEELYFLKSRSHDSHYRGSITRIIKNWQDAEYFINKKKEIENKIKKKK